MTKSLIIIEGVNKHESACLHSVLTVEGLGCMGLQVRIVILKL